MQIFIFFPEEAKVGVKTLKVYLERMKDSNATRAILVVQSNLTAFGKNILATFQPKYIVEVVSWLVVSMQATRCLDKLQLGSQADCCSTWCKCSSMSRSFSSTSPNMFSCQSIVS